MNAHSVLFLCTGNYFRSRFAEILFNHRASILGLDWVADSRGIAVELGGDNVGPISAHTLRGLASRGIPLVAGPRLPEALTAADLHAARQVIAVKEAEHRPLLDRKFPGWAERVEFWRVDDIDCAPPELALEMLEWEVEALLRRLAAWDGVGR